MFVKRTRKPEKRSEISFGCVSTVVSAQRFHRLGTAARHGADDEHARAASPLPFGATGHTRRASLSLCHARPQGNESNIAFRRKGWQRDIFFVKSDRGSRTEHSEKGCRFRGVRFGRR